MMAAHPVTAYKRVTMIVNGVTKNVVVPVAFHASQQKAGAVDDECVITNIESSGSDSQDVDVEPVEIIPCENETICSTTDTNLSFEKSAPPCKITDPPLSYIANLHPTVAGHLRPNRPTGIVNPMSFNSNVSTDKIHTARAETEQPDPTAIFANIVNESSVGNVELDLQSDYMQADPVVIAPTSGFEASSVSVISAPRTMTKKEAIAAGWFNDQDTEDQFQSSNVITATKACCDPSVLSGTSSFSPEPIDKSNFVSSAEYVSLETSSGYSTDFAAGASNHMEIVPIISSAEEMPYTYAISDNPGIEINVAADGRPHHVAKLEKPTFDYVDDEDNYYRLMSEEDEPLTAVLEMMDQDNAMPVEKAKQQHNNAIQNSVKRGRGRPRTRLPSSGHDATETRNSLLSENAESLTAKPLTAVLEMLNQDNALCVAKANQQYQNLTQNPVKRGRGRPRSRLPSSDHDAEKTNSLLSENAELLIAKPVIEIDMADDWRPHLVTNLQMPTFSYDDREDSCDRLMSEEVDPLAAIVEGMDNDDAVCMVLSKTRRQYKKLTGTTLIYSPARPRKKSHSRNYNAAQKRTRLFAEKAESFTAKLVEKTVTKTGTLSPLKLPSSTGGIANKVNKAKRTGGRPRTAAERYCLKDCGVWLQKLGILAATINAHTAWRYMCCRHLKPHATISCSLCRSMELKVAQKFRAGIQNCTQDAKVWCEFSLDPNLLPKSTTTASNELKKYLLVRTETGTFCIPVDSAVGCIVSEQEAAQMMGLGSQLQSFGECSVTNAFAACGSQLQQKTTLPGNSLASKAQNNAAASGPHTNAKRGRGKHGKRNVGADSQISLRKHLSTGLVHKARRRSTGNSMMRELLALGLETEKFKRRSRTFR